MKDQTSEKQEKNPAPTPSMDNGKGANDTIRSYISNTISHFKTTGEELRKAGQKSAREGFKPLRNGGLKTSTVKAFETLKTAGEAKAEIKEFSGKISEDVMMPVIKILSKYNGTAILPVAKHLDPVIGYGLHMVAMLPASVPVPIPFYTLINRIYHA